MRYKRIRMSTDLLMHMITEGYEIHTICRIGIPNGAKFKYAISPQTAYLDFVVEHASFRELKPGEEIPIFEVTMEKIKCPLLRNQTSTS